MFLLGLMYAPKRFRPYQWLTTLNLSWSPGTPSDSRESSFVTLFG